MNQELKQIKKKYGERMMHLCRELFPTILDSEGKLIEILDSKFGHPKYLYDDIIGLHSVSNFKNFIYSKYDSQRSEKIVSKTPFELMNEAGYTLYECHNNDEIMEFKKYYSSGEELCTFRDERLKHYHVFFAVKKNVDEIKRDHFQVPQRQDEYGTSVISIQFSRGDINTLSIKNRYNHTVNYPDATFSNNLDNIIEGLTSSFEKHYHLNINQNDVQIDLGMGYVKANDGKYYKYNIEANNVYYCPDNIIIDNSEINKQFIDKEKYLIIDNYILNLQTKDQKNKVRHSDLPKKSICMYDYSYSDSFIENMQFFDKININKTDHNTKIIELIKNNHENVYIEIDKYHNIIGYTNLNLEHIGSGFMAYNKSLQHINISNVTKIEKYFLRNCISLKSIKLDKVVSVGTDFLYQGLSLEYLYAPSLKKIGSGFLAGNGWLTSLYLEKVEEVGANFLRSNRQLEYISMPNLKEAGINFLVNNECLTQIDLPKLEELKDNFLSDNEEIKSINLPSVKEIGLYCLSNVRCLTVDLPSVEKIDHGFMKNNIVLSGISLPKVIDIGNDFLSNNLNLRKIDFPNVLKIGDKFLNNNQILEEINIPNCHKVGNNFLIFAEELKQLVLPHLKSVGTNFLTFNTCLNYLYAPNLQEALNGFLEYNKGLINLYLPSFEEMHFGFLENNYNLRQIYMPKLDWAPSDFSERLKQLNEDNKSLVYKLGNSFR